MKRLLNLLAVGTLLASASSCSSFLDINENPNSPLTVTPNAILAQALSTTASNYTGGNPSFNTYGNWTAGYWGRSGTVNGYGTERSYNYTTTFYQGLWNNTYDNLNDYQIIQTQGATNGFLRHAAIARIMKVYNYLLLVDQYGNLPYNSALGGLTKSTTPTYDDAAAIYRDFITQLSGAITDINTATTNSATERAVGSEDIVFQGNMTNWKRFANTLKLRILLRESQTNDATLNAYVTAQMAILANTQLTPDGFITADVMAQPGYLQTAGKQNPFYNRYGINSTATSYADEYYYQLPTRYLVRQYTANSDPRIARLYIQYNGAYVGANLGEASPTVGSRASAQRTGAGFLKSFNQPTPLMLLAEHLFSKAEAESRGLYPGGDAQAKTDYLAGIQASFTFTYAPAPGATAASTGATEYANYIAANATNALVNWEATTTTVSDGVTTLPAGSTRTVGKQEKIIYQKYLALNTVGSIEAWDDYRRTSFPKFTPSAESNSPRPDKLPTRLLYPQTEIATNASNIPANVNQYSKIFWDVVD